MIRCPGCSREYDESQSKCPACAGADLPVSGGVRPLNPREAQILRSLFPQTLGVQQGLTLALAAFALALALGLSLRLVVPDPWGPIAAFALPITGYVFAIRSRRMRGAVCKRGFHVAYLGCYLIPLLLPVLAYLALLASGRGRALNNIRHALFPEQE